MTPKPQEKPNQTHPEYPTSPWTEAYQNGFAEVGKESESRSTSQQSFNSDDQQPTHDALSDIYNRSY